MTTTVARPTVVVPTTTVTSAPPIITPIAPPPPATTPYVPPPTVDLPRPEAPSPAGVYYKNCTAARAAGAAPILRGEPGYRPGLDGNSDGVACE
ncbi:excalibur calcium-binding domain-containing protein [Nocardia sp. NPDC023988]|uniref:excalibur calcium-binding domain-containing protein n=1 Tax=unclassified Nocardia TaxID=2637762 RepID=UPI00340A3F0E